MRSLRAPGYTSWWIPTINQSWGSHLNIKETKELKKTFLSFQSYLKSTIHGKLWFVRAGLPGLINRLGAEWNILSLKRVTRDRLWDRSTGQTPRAVIYKKCQNVIERQWGREHLIHQNCPTGRICFVVIEELLISDGWFGLRMSWWVRRVGNREKPPHI